MEGHPNHIAFHYVYELGWALDQTLCIGLHASFCARPYLAPNRKIMATMRDGASVNELANCLCRTGLGIHKLQSQNHLATIKK